MAETVNPYAQVPDGASSPGVGSGLDGPSAIFRDDDGPRLGGGDDAECGIIATQSLDLEMEQDAIESRGRERSLRAKLAAAACLLVAAAFGGREYYARAYADGRAHWIEDDGDGASGGPDGIDGGEFGYGSDDLGISEELFEGGEILDINEGGGDDGLGGVDMYEGDVDDEINNGEIAGNFDNDMDYDDAWDTDLDDYDDAGAVVEDPGYDDAYDDGAVADGIEGGDQGEDAEWEEDAGGWEEEGGEGEFDEGDAMTFETNSFDEDEGEEPEPASADEDLVQDEEEGRVSPDENEIEEGAVEEGALAEEGPLSASGDEGPSEDEEDDAPPSDEDAKEGPGKGEEPAEEGAPPPDEDDTLSSENYFVPLTPEERDEMRGRLRDTLRATRDSLLGTASDVLPQRTLVLDSDSPKQFMHMHHMKTGGTSVDGLISCALRRQADLHNGTSVNYSRMSECGSTVKRCMSDLANKLDASVVDNVFYRNNKKGEARIKPKYSFDPADQDVDDFNVCRTSEAGVMSYCASLHAVRTFGWRNVDKITVIRDPVDRAWSMYRYSLQRCYKCMEMKEVLRSVVKGTFVTKERGGGRGREGKVGMDGDKGDNAEGNVDKDVPNFVYGPNDSCAVQMIGHQSTNLLSSVDLYNQANDVRFPREREIVEEAVRNLREEFTWIGVTDRLQESIDGFRAVFPFLSENLNGAAGEIGDVLGRYGGGDGAGGGAPPLPEGYVDEEGCEFQHKNAGRNPTCGTTKLDDETIDLIRKVSSRDVAVYRAAVERFELQQEVLEEYRAGDL